MTGGPRARIRWLRRAALALALAGAPLVLPEYYLAQLSFICIYAIAGAGLMLLAGYTGQISLGHAAFLGTGAYVEAIAQAHGLPFAVSLAAAALVAAATGIVVGLPALRLEGIYLAIATLAFGFIGEELFTRWTGVTGGAAGMPVAPVVLFGYRLDDEWKFYLLCLVLAALVLKAVSNLLRAPTGRAFVAIRDAPFAARSLGIDCARYKTLSFALSAGAAGLAGALYAHRIGFVSPEAFGVLASIELLAMILIGGLGTLPGIVLGAGFIVALPQALVAARDVLPEAIARQAGLQPAAFGLAIVLVVMFEPQGLYGSWLRIRSRIAGGPVRRPRARQRSYRKSGRT